MGWELFRRDSPGGFEMVGVDGQMLGEAPVAHLPVAVEITITAPSTLPGELSHTEQAIVTITDRLGGRIAGTIRSASTLWTLVYLPTDREAGRLAEIALPARASIDVAPAVDPDWQIFDRVRPVGVEQQSLADLAVMAEGRHGEAE